MLGAPFVIAPGHTRGTDTSDMVIACSLHSDDFEADAIQSKPLM